MGNRQGETRRIESPMFHSYDSLPRLSPMSLSPISLSSTVLSYLSPLTLPWLSSLCLSSKRDRGERRGSEILGRGGGEAGERHEGAGHGRERRERNREERQSREMMERDRGGKRRSEARERDREERQRRETRERDSGQRQWRETSGDSSPSLSCSSTHLQLVDNCFDANSFKC